ncbi:MAG: carboxylase, partial [Chloroflexota bacterium]|nr:carboxylase [Chloroflexota bacterium]
MNTPFVAMICGSRSDLPTLEEGGKVLDELDVPHEIRVIS